MANGILEKLGLSMGGKEIRRQPEALPSSLYQSDDINAVLSEASQNRIDLQGITSGQIPGLAPIPVPGFAGPQVSIILDVLNGKTNKK